MTYPLQLAGAIVVLLVGLACLERRAWTRDRRRSGTPPRPQ
jgi:hypothetical protein